MEKDNNMPDGYISVSSDNIIVYRYGFMEKYNNMMSDILYRYALMKKDNNMLLDIFVFLLTISYWYVF
jgi:hypothetical protein